MSSRKRTNRQENQSLFQRNRKLLWVACIISLCLAGTFLALPHFSKPLFPSIYRKMFFQSIDHAVATGISKQAMHQINFSIKEESPITGVPVNLPNIDVTDQELIDHAALVEIITDPIKNPSVSVRYYASLNSAVWILDHYKASAIPVNDELFIEPVEGKGYLLKTDQFPISAESVQRFINDPNTDLFVPAKVPCKISVGNPCDARSRNDRLLNDVKTEYLKLDSGIGEIMEARWVQIALFGCGFFFAGLLVLTRESKRAQVRAVQQTPPPIQPVGMNSIAQRPDSNNHNAKVVIQKSPPKLAFASKPHVPDPKYKAGRTAIALDNMLDKQMAMASVNNDRREILRKAHVTKDAAELLHSQEEFSRALGMYEHAIGLLKG